MSTPARAARRRPPAPSPRPAPPRAASPRASSSRATAVRPTPAKPHAGRPPSPRPRSATATAGAMATAAATAAATATAAHSAPQARRRPAAPAPTPLAVVVRPRRVRRLRMVGGLAAVLLFAALLGLAVFHSMLVQGQLGIDRADDQIEQEQMHQRELRERVAALAAPDRIVAEATRRGMVQPQQRAYLPAVVPGAVVPPPEAE
jgi:cell division protein FtsL